MGTIHIQSISRNPGVVARRVLNQESSRYTGVPDDHTDPVCYQYSMWLPALPFNPKHSLLTTLSCAFLREEVLVRVGGGASRLPDMPSITNPPHRHLQYVVLGFCLKSLNLGLHVYGQNDYHDYFYQY